MKGINLFPKKKSKNGEYGHKVYKNLSDVNKQRLLEYRKRYY